MHKGLGLVSSIAILSLGGSYNPGHWEVKTGCMTRSSKLWLPYGEFKVTLDAWEPVSKLSIGVDASSAWIRL